MKLPLPTTAAGFLLLSSLALGGPPAAISEDEGGLQSLRSFRSFASSWMDKMERVELRNRANPQIRADGARRMATYKGYGSDFEIEVKPTGYARAPFVGILRYTEQVFTCADERAVRCRIAATVPVTEIFRFQDGRWVY